MASSTQVLRRLGEALLNATLLLAAIVLFLAVMLVWQLRGFADDMRTGLRTELVVLQPRVDAARQSAQAALGALEAARQAQPDAVVPPEAVQAQERLRTLLDTLATWEPSAAETDPADGIWQRLVLALVATAAQGIINQPER